MSASLRGLAVKLDTLVTDLQAMPVRVVEVAAAAIERSINRQIGKDAPRRRVVGGAVGTKSILIRSGPNPAVLVKATGPLHLLSNPTRPHGIAARRHEAMVTPYGPRSHVNHPGTRGKGTWQHGVEDGRPLALAAADATAVETIRLNFGRL